MLSWQRLFGKQWLHQQGLAAYDLCILCGGPDALRHRIAGGCCPQVPAMHPNIRSHWIIESDTAAEQEAKEAGYAMHFEIVAPADDQQLNFWAENGSKNIK